MPAIKKRSRMGLSGERRSLMYDQAVQKMRDAKGGLQQGTTPSKGDDASRQIAKPVESKPGVMRGIGRGNITERRMQEPSKSSAPAGLRDSISALAEQRREKPGNVPRRGDSGGRRLFQKKRARRT